MFTKPKNHDFLIAGAGPAGAGGRAQGPGSGRGQSEALVSTKHSFGTRRRIHSIQRIHSIHRIGVMNCGSDPPFHARRGSG